MDSTQKNAERNTQIHAGGQTERGRGGGGGTKQRVQKETIRQGHGTDRQTAVGIRRQERPMDKAQGRHAERERHRHTRHTDRCRHGDKDQMSCEDK